jgi:CheY-like chemotaxis protein/HPt (histidine-containing phosphotransfer) domain-containing protein
LPCEAVDGPAPAAAGPPRHPSMLPADRPAAPTVEQALAENRLLLVAEDDVVNQKVVLKQLELLGYAADVAPNGAIALRLWQEGRHALLLTDLHMPELDGYGLARAVREAEALRPVPSRIPILALTANALRDEAGRVLAAGMDEYLTKPIRLATLGDALGRWLPHPARAAPAAAVQAVPEPDRVSTGSPIDVAVLKSLIGDDMETVREFLAEFLASARGQAAEILASCDADDHDRVGAVAHKLKASSRSVGAAALGDLCAELESASRGEARSGLGERRKRFEVEMRAVDACIVETLAESTA